ncbi:MAG: T9SS type A sorting domain-containing protein [Bacteroidota bacterium]
MKTTNFLRVLTTVLVFVLSSMTTHAQCPSSCPNTESNSSNNGPSVTLDPAKQPCCHPLVENEICYSPNGGTVGIYYEFSYRVYPNINGSFPNYISFDANLTDIWGNPLTVHSPGSGTNNSFNITFNLGNLTATPSGPYNATFDANSKFLKFDLAYEVDVPAGFPTDYVVIADMRIAEWINLKTRPKRVGYYELYSGLCTDVGESDLGKRQGKQSFADQINAYPNPFIDHVEMEIMGPREEIPQLSVLGMNAQAWNLDIRKKYVGGDRWLIYADTQRLTSGIYLFKVSYGDKVHLRKLIKE